MPNVDSFFPFKECKIFMQIISLEVFDEFTYIDFKFKDVCAAQL
jgi:hypothetical protein